MEAGSAVEAMFTLALGSGIYDLRLICSAIAHERRLAAAAGIVLPSAQAAAMHYGGDTDLTERLRAASEEFADKIEKASIEATWAGSRDSNWEWVGRVAAKLENERFRQIVQEVRKAYEDLGEDLKSSAFWRWWAIMVRRRKFETKGPAELL